MTSQSSLKPSSFDKTTANKTFSISDALFVGNVLYDIVGVKEVLLAGSLARHEPVARGIDIILVVDETLFAVYHKFITDEKAAIYQGIRPLRDCRRIAVNLATKYYLHDDIHNSFSSKMVSIDMKKDFDVSLHVDLTMVPPNWKENLDLLQKQIPFLNTIDEKYLHNIAREAVPIKPDPRIRRALGLV